MASGVGQKIVSILIGFVSRWVYIAYLGREFVGVNGLFSHVLTFLSLAELGVGSAITVYLYKPLAEHDERTVRTYMHFYKKCYRVIGWAVLALGAALVPVLPRLVKFEGAPPVNLYLVYGLFLANSVASYWFFAYKSSILSADQKAYHVNNLGSAFSILASLAKCGVVMLFHSRPGAFELALAAELGVGILKNVCIARKADALYPYIRAKTADPMPRGVLAAMFRDVRALFINNLSFKLLSAVDTIVVSAALGTALVGSTENYTMIINYVVMVIAMVTVSLAPSVGNLSHTEGQARRMEVFKQLDLANFWISCVSAACLYQLLTPFIQLFFRDKGGADLTLSGAVVACLVFRFYMGTVNNTLTTFKNAMGLLRQGCYLALAGGVLNVFLTLWLAARMGLVGVYLSTVVSEVFTTFFAQGYYVFHDGFGLPWKGYVARMAGRMALAAAVVLATHAVCGLFAGPGLGNFILQCAVCAVLPNLVLLALFARDPAFLGVLGRAKGILAGLAAKKR